MHDWLQAGEDDPHQDDLATECSAELAQEAALQPHGPRYIPYRFGDLPMGTRFLYEAHGETAMYCKLAVGAAQCVDAKSPHCGTVFYLCALVDVLTA